ncbi:hypothetical protein VOI32_15615 [Paraburkholderia caribensis]|uniref:Uncharacterized protein n=1 Tax=Paraburkholderia caribensis TaxID=75105 RepID=A0A9Q6WLD7_9BURK|nr:hypothetical protein [Paraburkholderia caribensis]MCO4875780.1 hypothetical protein [Paraburkholderia caribensis]PTB28464.1 hypothetical protein C9I56_13235 [Paraburkholderia caribensis]QLB62584.1 hypothetical protein A9O66_09440 [Paraburkholderia caribensis]
MRIFKISLKNQDGSQVSYEQLAQQYGADKLKRIDPALTVDLPDGELTPEQAAVVIAAAA